MSEYSLLLAFDTDDPLFARGFEAGRLWTLLHENPDELYEQNVSAANAEMVLRIAEATNRPVRSEELGDGWLAVIFRSGVVMTIDPADLAEARRLAETVCADSLDELAVSDAYDEFLHRCNPAFVLELVREVERLLDVEADQKYQLERAAILCTAVGRARLALMNGESADALAILDAAADKTRSLLDAALQQQGSGSDS